MASERSHYEKIRRVLEVAGSDDPPGRDAFVERVLARSFAGFRTRQEDAATGEFSWRQSERAVRKTVHFSKRMDLLEDGRLTRLGSHALLDYDGVLAERVRDTLRESGVSPARLNGLIREAARSEPPELLGARELRGRVETTIGRAEFARLLTLLAHAGAAETYRRKVYVRFRV